MISKELSAIAQELKALGLGQKPNDQEPQTEQDAQPQTEQDARFEALFIKGRVHPHYHPLVKHLALEHGLPVFDKRIMLVSLEGCSDLLAMYCVSKHESPDSRRYVMCISMNTMEFGLTGLEQSDWVVEHWGHGIIKYTDRFERLVLPHQMPRVLQLLRDHVLEQ